MRTHLKPHAERLGMPVPTTALDSMWLSELEWMGASSELRSHSEQEQKYLESEAPRLTA